MSHSYLDQGSIAAGQHFVVGSLQLALPLDFVIASVRRLENRVLGELQLFWFDSFDQFHNIYIFMFISICVYMYIVSVYICTY